MDQASILHQVASTNILVREEVDTAPANIPTLPVQGEKPGITPPLRRLIAANVVPILKALVIITLFLLDGIGFSPLGCKTQFLMSSRFWYNKQIVIFFIIYFIINLGADTISKLTDPIQQLIISIAVLLFYNIVARLGDVWWNKDPWYWPGPMTYFGLIALPMVSIVILDDMRRYYMAENAIFIHAKTIDKIRMAEIMIIAATLLIIIYGFIQSALKSFKIHGKYFSFLAFFWGVPMGSKKTGKVERCDSGAIKKIKREVGLAKRPLYTSNLKVLTQLMTWLLPVIIGMIIGYFALWKKFAAKIWSIYKNEYRNATITSTPIN
jgi:hypothetical protein